MGNIYSHSYCNIAATGFSNGSNGLFVDREPLLLMPIPLRLQNDIARPTGSASDKRQIEIHKGDYFLLDVDVFNTGVNHSPLNQRGWVVQERALSPRTLHFGSEQLF
jgi:hypothetical protein